MKDKAEITREEVNIFYEHLRDKLPLWGGKHDVAYFMYREGFKKAYEVIEWWLELRFCESEPERQQFYYNLF